ncbi:MAG TPA: hypothetical protein P5158_07225 [Chitinophagaceae bacterium]|nr:hypothetical protein [Chitinophagales bacterium]HRX93887.1 hypothetical protein [Chitinophagaceae bacterium]
MKKIFFSVLIVLIVSEARSQANLTGMYGYSMPLENTVSEKEKSAVPGGRLILIKIEGNQYRFWLDVLTGPPGYNRGETDGIITFVNDTASFDNTYEDAENPCILKFQRKGKTISINSQSTSFNCGFGNGVSADGEFTWLEKQETLNNEWLKKQYLNAPVLEIKSGKAQLYHDQDGFQSFYPKKYLSKNDSFMNIAETETTVYTEFIDAVGNLTWGWIRKSDIKSASE